MHVNKVIWHKENEWDNMGNFTSKLYNEKGYR